MKDKFDLITSEFTHVRLLGDRKGIEEKTTTWDKVIVDRQSDLSELVGLLKRIQERRIMILALPTITTRYADVGIMPPSELCRIESQGQPRFLSIAGRSSPAMLD